MLGKFVKVRVTSPMYSYNKRFGFKYKLNYGIMEGFKTKPSKEGIILSGGGSKSPVWSQLLADISGLPVKIPEVADLACVGAAIMAGVGCGLFEDETSGYKKLAVGENVLMPDLEKTKIYAPLFEDYKKKAEALS